MMVYILFITAIYLLMGIYELTRIFPSASIENIKIYEMEKDKKKFGACIYIGIILAILFSALRYDVGWDYMAYYETIAFGRVTNISLNQEYLTLLLIRIAKRFEFAQMYFILNAIITISLIMNTIKRYSKDSWISFIFFLTFPLFYLNSLSVIRNFTAIAIVFFGFKYIERRQLMKYIITVVIATLFHKSAIISILFYFIVNIKLRRTYYFILMTLAPMFSNILNQIIIRYFPKYAIYTNLATGHGGTKAIVVLFLIMLIAILFKDKLIENSRKFNMYFNIYFLGVCIYLTFIRQGTLGHRLSLYGTIYSLIILPEIIKLFRHSYFKFFIKFGFYGLCIFMFLYTIKIGRNTYIPYQIFF